MTRFACKVAVALVAGLWATTASGSDLAAPAHDRSPDDRRLEQPMAAAPHEQLVILDPARAEPARAALERLATVTQVLWPRLVLIRGGHRAGDGIRAIPGVLGLHDAFPTELPADLTPEERAFITAWTIRGRAKHRPGEGLDWDAPGFQPPGRPD